MRNHVLLAAIALVAMSITGRAAAGIQPSSDVLLPYFEVDLDKDARTTPQPHHSKSTTRRQTERQESGADGRRRRRPSAGTRRRP
jgi:hypothetical protein